MIIIKRSYLFICLFIVSFNAHAVIAQYYSNQPDAAAALTAIAGNSGGWISGGPSYCPSTAGGRYQVDFGGYRYQFFACLNTYTCPVSGEIIGVTSGVCEAPPVICPQAGDTRVLSLLIYTPLSDTLHVVPDSGEYVYEGCSYSAPVRSSPLVCKPSASNDDPLYCNFTVTSLAQASTATSHVAQDGSDSVIPDANLVDSNGCITLSGVTTCPTSDSTDNCYLVNGTKVCPISSTSAVIDGVTVSASDSQNCAQGVLGVLCVDTVHRDMTLESYPDISTELSDYVETSESTSVVTNVDNSVTTTTTNTTNVLGSLSTTVTTTDYPDGTSTSTTATENNDAPSPVISDSDLSALGEKIDITNELLTDIKGNKETDFDITGLDSDLGAISDNAISELASGVTNFSTPFTTEESISTWLPSLPTNTCSGAINTTIFGRPFVLDPCAKLQPLRDVLAWVFSFLAILSVIRTTFQISAHEE